jgi:hypothetical protein
MVSRRKLLASIGAGSAGALGLGAFSSSKGLETSRNEYTINGDEKLDCKGIEYALGINWKDSELIFSYDSGDSVYREDLEGAEIISVPINETGEDLDIFLDYEEKEAQIETYLECE